MLRAASFAMAGLFLAGVYASAEDARLLGAIEGRVRNAIGQPQAGAVIVLQNVRSQVVARTRTGVDGRFRFEDLAPAVYNLKVWAGSLVPAERPGIPVRAGMESMLSVQLASLLSSIELVSTQPMPGQLITDQWKWILRGNPDLRPVLRYQDGLGAAGPGALGRRSATRGLVQIAGGDAGDELLGHASDLGTTFALATSVFGASELQFSGNVGGGSGGAPATAFRTRYSALGSARSPEVEFTVRQLGLREHTRQALAAGPAAGAELPTLRSYAVKLQDRQDFGQHMRLDYGLMMEAIAFIDHVNVLSPFARLSVDTGAGSGLDVVFSSGAPGTELLPPAGALAAPAEAINGLTAFPRVSLHGGAARLQRSTSYELGYHLMLGHTMWRAAVYNEHVANQAFMVAGDRSALSAADLLPDPSSNSSIFNFGNFRSTGYMIAATQPIASSWNVTALYGAGGALRADATGMAVANAQDLRERMRLATTRWASTRIGGVLSRTGTYVSMAYIWTPAGRLIPTHAYLTQDWRPSLGLNLQVRQPLPAISGQLGHFEMTAEVRNLLAQGYQPVPSADGRTMLLVPYPRALRGGVSFIF